MDNRPTSPTHPPNVGVDRLTVREKECLRRWLHHQTAKQIALELGVSHHAVEKRLKMARTKMGVSTSLEAAQLLARSEGYDRLVSQPAELAQGGLVPSERPDHKYVKGAVIMSLTAITALALVLQAASNQAYAPPPKGSPQAITIDGPQARFVEATPDQIRAFLGTVFARTDRNKSGFIETGEAPDAFPDETQGMRRFLTGASARDAFIKRHDRDSDGKVSKTEFVETSFPGLEKRGIPMLPGNWNPAG